jgi:hypothetical protein
VSEALGLKRSNVEFVKWVGMFRSVHCQSDKALWMVGLEENVKDSIRKDGVVVGYRFCVDVESFNCVKVGPFLVAV